MTFLLKVLSCNTLQYVSYMHFHVIMDSSTAIVYTRMLGSLLGGII